MALTAPKLPNFRNLSPFCGKVSDGISNSFNVRNN